MLKSLFSIKALNSFLSLKCDKPHEMAAAETTPKGNALKSVKVVVKTDDAGSVMITATLTNTLSLVTLKATPTVIKYAFFL